MSEVEHEQYKIYKEVIDGKQLKTAKFKFLNATRFLFALKVVKLSRYWLIIEYHKDWIADLAHLKAKKIIGFIVNMLEHMLMVILVFCSIEMIYAYFS